MWLISLVVGVVIGSMFGFGGALLGGSVGALIGILFTKINKSEQEFSLQLKRMHETIMRLSTRLDGLEKSQRGEVTVSDAAPEPEPVILAPIVMARSFPLSTTSPSPLPQDMADAWQQRSDAVQADDQGLNFESLTSSALWQKLFGGNILAKVGVVLLFFGVASALKLAADYGMFPVPVRLLLAAVASVAMIMFGWSRATGEKHRMFGFALQGGGFAILYLIVYFMLVRYQMIAPQLAFVLFTLLGVSCLLIAAKLDSVPVASAGRQSHWQPHRIVQLFCLAQYADHQRQLV